MSPAPPAPPARAPLVALGALIGAYSTLCGIGGGVFAVPLLHFVHRFALRAAVANSLVLVCASTTVATLLELFHPHSELRLDVVLALVAGSLLGAGIGFAIARRISAAWLKGLFALVLVAVALHVLLDPEAAGAFDPSQAGVPALTWGQRGLVALVGVAAGIAAPLFGVGGGLVAVPALLLLLPGLGFLVARACSMAMSAVAAWQSAWLYRRSGELVGTSGLWLAAGAVGGAAVGVQLVHVEEVARVARGLVAFALLFAAARFAWDLALARRAARSAPGADGAERTAAERTSRARRVSAARSAPAGERVPPASERGRAPGP